MKFLELAGSYSKGPEWTVIRDIPVRNGVVYDLTKLPIPFIEDESLDGVYSEHFIEHMTKEQGIQIFKEMYRIMKPGSVIRTVWPSKDFIDYLNSETDLSNDKFVNLYINCIIIPENVFKHEYYNNINGIDDMNKQQKVALRLLHQEGEHKHLWYKQEMIDVLKEIGFKNVKEEKYQESRLSNFNNIENKQEMRPLHSTIIEAEK